MNIPNRRQAHQIGHRAITMESPVHHRRHRSYYLPGALIPGCLVLLLHFLRMPLKPFLHLPSTLALSPIAEKAWAPLSEQKKRVGGKGIEMILAPALPPSLGQNRLQEMGTM